MDKRKINFLIGIQKEIDRLEEGKEKLKGFDKLKSKFYDLADIEEIVETSQKGFLNVFKKVSKGKRYENAASTNTEIRRPFLLATHSENIKTKISDEPKAIKVKIEKTTKEKHNKAQNVEHNPQLTIALLKNFSNDNSFLKFTTHSWEEGKFDSYEDFMTKIRSQWKDISTSVETQRFELYNKIISFLFYDKLGEKNDRGYPITWGEHRLKIGWSSPELIVWCKNNDDPLKFPLPKEKRTTIEGKSIEYFEDIVNTFKNEIEVREENNQLYKLFRNLKNDYLQNSFDIDLLGLKSLKGLSFYTDVQWVKKGLNRIFDNIKKRENFNKVIIQAYYSADVKKINIEISQLESFCNRNINDPKLSGKSGDFAEIKRAFYNLCDWSVTSKFRDGNFRINYLGPENEPFIQKVKTADGFKHTLTFYL